MKLLSGLIVALIYIQTSYTSSKNKEGKKWAFLAATSNGWINYRHQADLCHAYHLLRENGIPAENIVTMFYDDIAYNSMNKHPGVIINSPGGPNVYKGVRKDYTGKDVTVENFFNVLSGNKSAMMGKGTGRVIESGPNDNVFVYIVDHGDTGILLFPDNEYMYAHNLTQQLRNMRKANHFKKMLIYVEACKAGSMFDNILDDDLSVFVSTASATDEFSWARYCSTLDTCLGDYYSTTWMEHMDTIREDWSAKYTTLFKQFKNTRTKVYKSHVNIYGDYRLGYDKMSSFLGDNWVANKTKTHRKTYHPSTDKSAVRVNDLEVYYLKSRINTTRNITKKNTLQQELNILLLKRDVIDNVIDSIMKRMAVKDLNILKKSNYSKYLLKEEHFPCYQEMVDSFNKYCFSTYQNSYVTRHFYKLANLCILGHTKVEFAEAMKKTCSDEHKLLSNTV